MTFDHPVPSLRGVSHAVACAASVAFGTWLVLRAQMGREFAAALVYAVGLTGALAASALYHRVNWSARWKRLMRRVDHSMIFVWIAATYTPVLMVAMSTTFSIVSLSVIWLLTVAAIVARLAWRNPPRHVYVGAYITLGWLCALLVPWLYTGLERPVFILLMVGGLLYTIGAACYLFKRPNPIPRHVGFHEVFHGFVVAAAACHYVAVHSVIVG